MIGVFVCQIFTLVTALLSLQLWGVRELTLEVLKDPIGKFFPVLITFLYGQIHKLHDDDFY